MSGEELIRWTIRLALAAYVARIAIGLAFTKLSPMWESAARWLWTFGCLLLWIHVICAFRFEHDWSHAAAYTDTARKTAAVTRLDWGGGIWFNYLLMLLWAGDVAWWWSAPSSFRERPTIVEWVWQGWLAFMGFNAAVVFETGAIRWFGVAATTGLCLLWLGRLTPRNRRG